MLNPQDIENQTKIAELQRQIDELSKEDSKISLETLQKQVKELSGMTDERYNDRYISKLGAQARELNLYSSWEEYSNYVLSHPQHPLNANYSAAYQALDEIKQANLDLDNTKASSKDALVKKQNAFMQELGLNLNLTSPESLEHINKEIKDIEERYGLQEPYSLIQSELITDLLKNETDPAEKIIKLMQIQVDFHKLRGLKALCLDIENPNHELFARAVGGSILVADANSLFKSGNRKKSDLFEYLEKLIDQAQHENKSEAKNSGRRQAEIASLQQELTERRGKKNQIYDQIRALEKERYALGAQLNPDEAVQDSQRLLSQLISVTQSNTKELDARQQLIGRLNQTPTPIEFQNMDFAEFAEQYRKAYSPIDHNMALIDEIQTKLTLMKTYLDFAENPREDVTIAYNELNDALYKMREANRHLDDSFKALSEPQIEEQAKIKHQEIISLTALNKLQSELTQLKDEALNQFMTADELAQFESNYTQKYAEYKVLQQANPKLPTFNPEEPNALISRVQEENNKNYSQFSPRDAVHLQNKMADLKQNQKQVVDVILPLQMIDAFKTALGSSTKAPFDYLVVQGSLENEQQLASALSITQVKGIRLEQFKLEQFDRLKSLVSTHKVTTAIILPDPLQHSSLQFDLDQLLSNNKREPKPLVQAIAPTNKVPDPNNTRSRGHQQKPSIEQEIQQDTEQQVQVQVAVAQALTDDQSAESAVKLKPEDIIDRKTFAEGNNSLRTWDYWLGNINLLLIPLAGDNLGTVIDRIDLSVDPAAKERFPNSTSILVHQPVDKISAQALAVLKANEKQFQFGVDFQRLPPGFVVLEKEGVLHFDKDLVEANQRKPLSTILSAKTTPYKISSYVLEQWIQKQPKSNNEQALLQKYNELKQEGKYSTHAMDELKIAILSEQNREDPNNKSTANHLIYSIITDPGLENEVRGLAQIYQLDKTELSALMAVLDLHGEQGLSSVVNYLAKSDDRALMHVLIKNHLRSDESFSFLLDTAKQQKIDWLKQLNPTERSWWDKLYTAHSKAVGKDDFFSLIDDFKYFSEQMHDYANKAGITDFAFASNPDFDQVKNMPVALSRMLAIMKQCAVENFSTQWQELPKLDLQSNGAIVYLAETQRNGAPFRLVTQNMHVTPTHYVGYSNGGLPDDSGYSSIWTGNDKRNINNQLVQYPVMFPESKSEIRRRRLDAMESSDTPQELERNYYRFVHSEDASLSLDFYQKAADKINSLNKIYIPKEKEFFLKAQIHRLVCSMTTGLNQVASIDNEEMALAAIDKLMKRFNKWFGHDPLARFKIDDATNFLDYNSTRLSQIPIEHLDKLLELYFSLSDDMSENLVYIGSLYDGLINLNQGYDDKLLAKYLSQAQEISADQGIDITNQRNLIAVIGTFHLLEEKPNLYQNITEKMKHYNEAQKSAAWMAIEKMAKMPKNTNLNAALFEIIMTDVTIAAQNLSQKEEIEQQVSSNIPQVPKESTTQKKSAVALSNQLISTIRQNFDSVEQKQISKVISQFIGEGEKNLLVVLKSIILLNAQLKKANPDSNLPQLLSLIPLENTNTIQELRQLLAAISSSSNSNELAIFIDECRKNQQGNILDLANQFMTVGMDARKVMSAQGISKSDSLSIVSHLIRSGFKEKEDLVTLSTSITDLIKQYPSEKALLVNFLSTFELDNKDTFATLVQNLHELREHLPSEVIRSLIKNGLDDQTEHRDQSIAVNNLITLVHTVRSHLETPKTQADLLKMLSNLKNNNIPVSNEQLNTLLQQCKKDPQAIEQLKICYERAPYPPMKLALQWLANPADLKTNYDAFSKKPCERDTVDNGFKMSKALDQLKGINVGKERISTDELDALQKAIVNAQGLETEDLRARVKPPAAITEVERVAFLSELLYRAKGVEKEGDQSAGKKGATFELNTTQYLSLLLLSKERRLTEELATGEGKSRVMMVACAMEHSRGQTVDFLTTNTALALRDYLEYQAYFSCIGAATQVITSASQFSDYKKGGINFSDVSNISLFRNRARVEHQEDSVLADAAKRSLLLDEADQTYFDSASTHFNYSIPTQSTLGDMTWIYSELVKFAQITEYQDLYYDDKSAYDMHCKAYIAHQMQDHPQRLAQLERLSPNQLHAWQEAAKTAIALEYGKDYVVEANTPTNTQGGPKLTSQALLIYNNRTLKSSKFSLGVHQCLHALLNLQLLDDKTPVAMSCKAQVKPGEFVHAFEVEAEKQIVYSTSSKAFLDDYDQGAVLAVTGTAGAAIERQEAGRLANMSFANMPRHNRVLREDKPMHIANDANGRRKALLDYIKAAKGKPLLLIAETDEESKLIEKLLKELIDHAKDSSPLKQLKPATLLSNASNDEEAKVIAVGGQPGAITISTGRMGRGSDIKPAQGTKGLSTLITYPPSERDLIQFQGRSGRFGAEGETRIVVDKEQIRKFIGSQHIPKSLFTATEGFVQLEQLRLARSEQSTRLISFILSDYKEQMTKFFYQQLKTYPENKDQCLVLWADFLKDMDQRWANHGQTILKALDNSSDISAVINSEFAKFQEDNKGQWLDLNKALSEEIQVATIPTTAVTTRMMDALKDAKKEKDNIDAPELKTAMHQKYDKALAGRATVFPTMFTETRALFTDNRKLFANTRAALKGEGVLFADTMALLTGKRPLFANLRAWINQSQNLQTLDLKIDKHVQVINDELIKDKPNDVIMKEQLNAILDLLTEKATMQSGHAQKATYKQADDWNVVRQIVFKERDAVPSNMGTQVAAVVARYQEKNSSNEVAVTADSVSNKENVPPIVRLPQAFSDGVAQRTNRLSKSCDIAEKTELSKQTTLRHKEALQSDVNVSSERGLSQEPLTPSAKKT